MLAVTRCILAFGCNRESVAVALPLFAETAHSVEQAVGSTAGVTGGGAEARPAEAAGADFGGLHLSDYEKQVTSATSAFAVLGSGSRTGQSGSPHWGSSPAAILLSG